MVEKSGGKKKKMSPAWRHFFGPGCAITRLCQLLNKTAEKKSAESKEISINPLLF
jgi:hypothetical protein